MICAKTALKYLKEKKCHEKRRKREHYKKHLLKMQRHEPSLKGKR